MAKKHKNKPGDFTRNQHAVKHVVITGSKDNSNGKDRKPKPVPKQSKNGSRTEITYKRPWWAFWR